MSAGSPDQDRLLTVRQAGAARGVCPRRLRRAIRFGDLHAYLLGKRWWLRLADLDRYLARQRIGTGTEGHMREQAVFQQVRALIEQNLEARGAFAGEIAPADRLLSEALDVIAAAVEARPR